MDNVSLIGMASIITAGLTIAIGSIGPALGEGRAVAQALGSIAQQPDEKNTITRTLLWGWPWSNLRLSTVLSSL